MLKQYLHGIVSLYRTLDEAQCTSRLCKWVRDQCSPEHMGPIHNIIEESIQDDAVYSKKPLDSRNNRVWAVKVSYPHHDCDFQSPSNDIVVRVQCHA